jgi:hypothetical protein
MTVHRRVPVEAAAEHGRQLAGRPHVAVRVQDVRDLVRVVLVQALERQGGEALDRGGVKRFAVLRSNGYGNQDGEQTHASNSHDSSPDSERLASSHCPASRVQDNHGA